MTTDKHCRVCSVPLTVGENWLACNAKCRNYVCLMCENETRRRRHAADTEVREQKREYKRANATAISEYQRKYRQNNAAALSERKREYRQANATALTERKREYYKANAHAIREKAHKYQKANAHTISKRRKAHPEMGRSHHAIRRARRVNAQAPSTSVERAAVRAIYSDARLAEQFTGTRMATDHQHPISKGGSSLAGNLQVIPWAMNASKHAKAHADALTQVNGYRAWTEGPPTFEQVSYRVHMHGTGKGLATLLSNHT
jgi:predicted nucleic acid-binding Zn ribbon protein